MCENIFIYPKTIPADYISLEQTGNSKTFANYRYYASHCSQPFFATGDYDGSIKLWRLEENGFKHPNFEKFLLKSRFLTITNIVFHKSLSFKFGSNTREFWSPSREITEISAVAIVIADKENYFEDILEPSKISILEKQQLPILF